MLEKQPEMPVFNRPGTNTPREPLIKSLWSLRNLARGNLKAAIATHGRSP